MSHPCRALSVGTLGIAALAMSACGGDSGFDGNGGGNADPAGLYFAADNGQVGEELWKSDGREDGTALLRDIAGSGAEAEPESFFRVGDRILFSATTPAEGRELWRTNGIEAGTELVADILPGSDGGVALRDAVTFEGALYFAARDGTSGEELWRSDGTAAGTERVADINPGADGSDPADFAVMDGHVYFSAIGDAGGELWRTNGDAAGTERVTDINASGDSFPRDIAVLDDALIFFANDGSTGREPWRSDGSPGAGATPIADINPGADGSMPTTACGPGFEATVLDGQLYFAANDGSTGVEMWRTDGSSAERITDINGNGDSLPCEPTVADGTLYFGAEDTDFDENLYRLDTTASATTVVQVNAGTDDILPGALTAMDGEVYFTARVNGGAFNDELWRTDGLGGGITQVAEIRPGEDGSQPRGMIAFDGMLYFGANDGSTGVELWRSDGTGPGTERVADINPSGDSDPAYLFGFEDDS